MNCDKVTLIPYHANQPIHVSDKHLNDFPDLFEVVVVVVIYKGRPIIVQVISKTTVIVQVISKTTVIVPIIGKIGTMTDIFDHFLSHVSVVCVVVVIVVVYR